MYTRVRKRTGSANDGSLKTGMTGSDNQSILLRSAKTMANKRRKKRDTMSE